MTEEIKAAIDFLKANGYKVTQAEKVTTINAEVQTDLALLGLRHSPPIEYIDKELAMLLGHEITKGAWKRTTLNEEPYRIDRATIWVILP